MANPAKAKGTAFESAIVAHLTERFGGAGRALGLVPRRVAQAGALDTGDVHGVSPFVIQAKAYKSLADGLREGVDGVQAQHVRAGEPFGVAVIKRPRKPIGQAYAVMTLDQWADLLLRLREAEDDMEHRRPVTK